MKLFSLFLLFIFIQIKQISSNSISNSISSSSSNSIPSYFNLAIIYAIEKNGLPSPTIPYFHTVLKAFEDINNKNDGILDDILPNTDLRIIHRSANDQFLRGAIKVGEALSTDPQKSPIMASIGPTNFATIRGATPAFQEAGGIPVINYRDRSALFGRSDLYPNMMRLIPGMYEDGEITAILISKYFRWEKVTLFYENTDSSRSSAQVFRHYAQEYDINILSSHILDSSDQYYSAEIEDAIEIGSRIFVLFLSPSVGVKLITQGQDLKLFNGKTQIIGGEELSTSSSWNSLKLSSETLNTLLNGYIGVIYKPYAPPSEMKTRFLNDWVNQKSTKGYVDNNGVSHCDTRMDYYNTSYLYQYYPGLDITKPLKCGGLNYSSYKTHTNLETELDQMMYAYDSVLSVALGLHHLIYNLNNTNPTPADLHSILLSKDFSFIGLTGNVSFSTEMEKDQLDVGGRLTGLIYNIVNYVPIEITDSTSSNVIFKTVITWNSETNFPDCNNHTHYVPDGHDNEPSCVSFQFQTKKNTLPYDSAPPVLKYIPLSYRLIMFVFSAIGVIGIILISTILYCFNKRRLVKMNQPILSYMMLLGMLLGFMRVILVTINATSNVCRTRLWLEHLGFQFIFGTLVVRSWRIYLVTCTMKRIKVTEKQCITLILLSMVITIGFLITLTLSDDKNSAITTIVKDQFEYTQNLVCDYDSRKILNGLYVYELFILFIGLILCWLIRNVQSTVSNTSVLLEGLITTDIVVIAMFILLQTLELDPYVRMLAVGIVIALVLLRLLWIFFAPLVYNLFSGYELDRALMLRKTEKNILQSLGCGKLSKQIFATHIGDDNDDHQNDSCKVACKTNKDTIASSTNNCTIKGYEKFAKSKNRDELNHEINRVKEELQKKQMELACLENMVFASGNDSRSQNSKNSSSRPDNRPSSNRDGSEHGNSSEPYIYNQETNSNFINPNNLGVSPSQGIGSEISQTVGQLSLKYEV